MNLYVDLDTLQLRASATDARLVSFLDAKRGDALPLVVRFYRSGSIVRLDATTTINFALKEEGKYDQDPLVLESSFTASAVGSPDSDPNYTATPSLNTSGLNALFNIDGDTSNDPSTVRLMGELTWQATGDTGPTSIKTFIVRMANDVYRGDETAPTSLETPAEWLDLRLDERGLYPIRSGATHFFPTSLTVSGEILGDDENPIALDDLAFLAVGASGFPSYSATLADTGTLTLSYGGSDWELEYDGPASASVVTYTVTSAKTDPTGLTLTMAGRDDITIVATDGTRAPVVGDRAWNTATNQNFVWGGEEWLSDLENRWDVIVVDGDSRSDGGSTGSWPVRLQSIRPFDGSDVTIVADSGAQAHERLAVFDAEVLPLAPTGSERGLYVLYIGVNDLFQIGGANYTVTRDIYDTIKELWAKARAAGFDVCAVTLQDADHTGTGVPFREERQELLNRMILAGSAHYDFVVPLHELCPDYTVYNTDALHFGADGNQFIAEQVAKILGATDRTANSPRQGQGLAEMEFNAIPASINAGRFLWPPYNLAMATEDTANSGTVTNLLGMKRLTGAASSGSVAGLRMRWQLVNSANRINWPTVSRYRGVVVSFARGTMSGDHVFRVSVGNNTEVFNVAGFGFELRNNGGAIEMRAIATDSSLVVNNSAWEVIGANANLMVVAFAKGADVTVLWSSSNGSNPFEVWQTISTTGAPTGVGGGGNVCAVLETTAASPSAQSVIDLRSIQAFESETLPLSATKFDYH